MLRYTRTLAFLVVMGCGGSRSPAAITPQGTDPDRAFADYVLEVRRSLFATRARLDSAVAQLHRLSGEGSARPGSRANEVIDRINVLDSSYRSTFADLSWIVSSSNGSSPEAARAGSPFELPPAPLLQPFGNGEDWMLLSPMVYQAGRGSRLIVIVPRGFVTDYASIPRPLRILLPNRGDYGNAAVIHDYLYWRQDCTRAQADNIMAIAMMEAGVPSATLRAIHAGVRLGGQGAWDRNRRDRQSGLVRTAGPPFDQVPPGGTWSAYRAWIQRNNGTHGMEYPVPQRVCAIGDSVRIRD
jgi:hypothetical protein